MRNWIKAALGAVLLLVATTGMQAFAQGKPIKLIVAHTGTKGNSVYIFFATFAKTLEQETNGQVQVQVHPGGELGGDQQLIQLVQQGSVNIASAATSNMGSFTSAYFWTDLPYIFKSRAGAHAVFQNKAISSELAAQVAKDVGTKVLAYIDVGGFRLLEDTKRPLDTPAAVKGLKFRVTANPISAALIRAWGGLATPVAWSGTFTAVQQGVVDGLNLQPMWTDLNGFGQVIKYATRNKAVMSFHVAQISLKTWNSLPPTIQQDVLKAAQKARNVADAADAQAESTYISQLKGDGVKIYTPTPAQMTQWRSEAETVYPQFKNKVNQTLLAQVREIQKGL